MRIFGFGLQPLVHASQIGYLLARSVHFILHKLVLLLLALQLSLKPGDEHVLLLELLGDIGNHVHMSFKIRLCIREPLLNGVLIVPTQGAEHVVSHCARVRVLSRASAWSSRPAPDARAAVLVETTCALVTADCPTAHQSTHTLLESVLCNRGLRPNIEKSREGRRGVEGPFEGP